MTTYLSYHLKGLPFDTRQEIHKRVDAVGVRAMENCLEAPDGYPGWRSVGYNDDDLARHLEKIKGRLRAVNEAVVLAERMPLFENPEDTYASAKTYFQLTEKRTPEELMAHFDCSFQDYWPPLNPSKKPPVHVQQFVMAYGVEQDRLRAILPDGFTSLRPVIRINAEIRDGKSAYLEVNTAVAAAGRKGWCNIKVLSDVTFDQKGQTTTFRNDELEISFTKVGIRGGCPAEKDNDGCFYIGRDEKYFAPAEKVDVPKEFCDCSFRWLTDKGTSGQSVGETLPAIPEPVQTVYPKAYFCLENAAKIPCRQVLGAYAVEFIRD